MRSPDTPGVTRWGEPRRASVSDGPAPVLQSFSAFRPEFGERRIYALTHTRSEFPDLCFAQR